MELLGNLAEPYMDQQSVLGAVLLSSLPVQPDHLTVDNVGYLSGGVSLNLNRKTRGGSQSRYVLLNNGTNGL